MDIGTDAYSALGFEASARRLDDTTLRATIHTHTPQRIRYGFKGHWAGSLHRSLSAKGARVTRINFWENLKGFFHCSCS
jgi:hypothetical protein